MRRSRKLLTVAGALSLVAGLTGCYPETPVTYPAGSTATTFKGLGFDTCSAPPVSAMKAWLASPYRAVNIYFGGGNRACEQPNLSAGWVSDVTAQGWRLIPTFVGRQPSCTLSDKPYRYNASTAADHGKANAEDAVSKAKALKLRPGSALYASIEPFDGDSSCVTAVRRYVSAWTETLHDSGYLAGVYIHWRDGLPDLSAVYNSTEYARPDAIWMARWDQSTALTGTTWPIPDSQWALHQRAKQFKGDHDETWGGVTLNIDSDSLDAPVATVSRPYKVTATALNARTGPSTSYPVVKTYPNGATLNVLCQTTGQKVGTTSVWDRLADGTWVSDLHVSTPSNTTFSAPLQKCRYPGQVTATSLNARTGPGASYPTSGKALPRGALAPVMCQKKGSKVETTSVWDRLDDGRWVSDYYVENRSNTTWSPPVPRCP